MLRGGAAVNLVFPGGPGLLASAPPRPSHFCASRGARQWNWACNPTVDVAQLTSLRGGVALSALAALATALAAPSSSSTSAAEAASRSKKERQGPRGARALAEAYCTASHRLAGWLQKLKEQASAELRASPPGPNWLPEGCEDAPPEIMAQLIRMTAGAGSHPPDPLTDAMQVALLREAEVQKAASGDQLPEDLLSLRPLLDASHLSSTSLGEDEVGAFAQEAVERWQDLEAALGGQLPRGAPPERDGRRIEVFATHLTNDDYVLGAQVLAASLAATGTTRPLVALVTSGLSERGREELRRAGWTLVDVSLAGIEGEDTVQSRGFFSKIWLWGLPCHRVVYIDTDVLVLENLDSLFSVLDSPTGGRARPLAAVPDSQPHMDGELVTQTGLLVLEPDIWRFKGLWEATSDPSRRQQKLDDWKQLEQGFLTVYFEGRINEDEAAPSRAPVDDGSGRGAGWIELHPKYNFCVRYCLRPLYDDLGPETAAMAHFACAKPWDPEQWNFAHHAYVRLYLGFANAARVPWRTVNCSADRAREREQVAKMQKFMSERGA